MHLKVTVAGNSLAVMPGTLAKWYRDMGGKVLVMGKPGEELLLSLHSH